MLNGNITATFSLNNISYTDEGYYYAIFAGSCGTVYSDTVFVTVHTTTAITSTFTNPLNVICEDAGISFAFAAEGHSLTYAWNYNGTGAGTDSTLTITSADTSESGFYQLVTSGDCGTDSSQLVQLIVHPTTRVLSTIADTAICEDSDITVPVSTDGYNVSYNWFQNGTQIGTGSDLVITDALSTDNGAYQLQLGGYCGVDSTDVFDVLVMPTTDIFASMGDTTACIGDSMTLSVHDTGFMNTYQWYKDGSMLSSALDSTLILGSLSAVDTGIYQLIATGSCGTDSSATLPIGAWKTTSILASSPLSFDICKGDQAQFYLEAEGSFLNFSWSKDGVTLPGSIDDTLLINNIQPAFAGYFIGTATGICGTSVTDTIQMDVHQAPNVTADPVSDTLCQFDNTALTVASNGFGVTYNWYFNGATVGTGSTLTLDSITYAEQGNYMAVADGYCGIDTAQTAFVKVDAILPSLSLPSYAFEICESDSVLINASSLLGQSVSVNWYKDSVLVNSGLSYNLADSGSYYAELTDLVTGCIETTPMADVIMHPLPEPVTISGEDTLYQNTPNWYWVNLEPNVNYDWSIPSGVITAGWSSDSVEIQFGSTGTHMVYLEAKNQFDCTTDLELEVLISGIVFYENQAFKYKVYPNPTVGRAVLTLEHAVTSNMKIEVVDVKGALVHSGMLLKGSIEYQMDLTNLRNGQYVINIQGMGISVPIVKTN
jgi:hypothetical protein